ncbi:MAG: reverse transcriptase-like protein [Kurthia sp.]|nr:reverse transcriptase-like protein [Candidatus Kurthia equi]
MLEVYIDGASAGNPGPSGIGIFIKGEGHLLKLSEPVGLMNNHEAEFVALIRGLEEATRLKPSLISVRSDSKIVVSSIEKRYAKHYAEFVSQALELIDQIDLFFIKWIPDSQNSAADALARQAISQNKS